MDYTPDVIRVGRFAVLCVGVIVLCIALFTQDLRFNQRVNLCIAAAIDFGACAFSYLYPKLMQRVRKDRAPVKIPLLCMRLADMQKIHPLMSLAEYCERCGAPLGVYPSGQRILAEKGREHIELVCNRCAPSPVVGLMLPETLNEVRDSIPNPDIQ